MDLSQAMPVRIARGFAPILFCLERVDLGAATTSTYMAANCA